jgi:hypothetical protein
MVRWVRPSRRIDAAVYAGEVTDPGYVRAEMYHFSEIKHVLD